jgi:hemoglobin-like flavoprotein
MSPEQRLLVKETWQNVLPIADTAARLFYDRLFDVDPITRALFETTDFAEQRRKLIQALASVVRGIDDLDGLLPTLRALGRRHTQYGVEDRHYATVGDVLLWTLEQGLGSAWTPQAKAAWSEAYAIVANAMRGGAPQEHPDTAPGTLALAKSAV